MSATLATLAVRRRHDETVAARLARSAAATTGSGPTTGAITTWIEERKHANRFAVERIAFRDLRDWSFDETTGDLGHSSGRFFTVEGRHCTVDDPALDWCQPIIRQPEVGILGLLAKEFDGVLHFLMQAKMEPGNPNLLQLSPTVQATRSNYSKVHRGSEVLYIDHFTTGLDRSRVLADSLQSEHGAWFLHKSNRNMVVEVTGDVPLLDGFCWLTLGQIGELLEQDNVVNMDTRTVLATLPPTGEPGAAIHTDIELLSWFTAERARHDLKGTRMPLRDLPGWVRDEHTIRREDGRFFSVVAVNVVAGNREVSSWTQPLFEPIGLGVAALLRREFGGVPHYLMHARVEGGFVETIELGPTVQCVLDNHPRQPAFLDTVLQAASEAIRYETVHSEEGGRFLNAESRYLVVDADKSQAPDQPPPGYAWLTQGQLGSLVRHNHYVNVQARTLLAYLNARGERS